ncbi:MAG: urea ABC transporter ATP-binding subunit UrtE [Gammaproteobacteria bacterium]|nr:urea ABC transporter ATP-binding subunit UrtE [Gammaproteobacteria bacterium]
MLQIKQLNQFYGESHTLWDVDVDVSEGACVCLMGRNGVGKTTLLKSIMGLLPIQSGQMQYKDKTLQRLPAQQRARLGIGYVPQGREIFPLLTVAENLRIGLSALGKNKRSIAARIYELFPVLKDMLQRRGGDLSGGQQQQLAIGRALTLDPKLLILDEPTEGIQPNIVQEIGAIILQLNQQDKLTVLLVEQKLPFARRVATQFVIMDKGRSVAQGAMPALSDAQVKQYLTV